MIELAPPSQQDKLWSGRLHSPLGMQAGLPSLRASIGRPAIWPAAAFHAAGWVAPQGQGECFLVMLAFSLRPPKGTHVREVNFRLRLHAQNGAQPIVLDAQPQNVLVEEKGQVKVSAGPEIQLGLVGLGASLAEASLDLGRLLPVVRLDGLQEAACCWHYEAHPRHPLVGSRRMLAVAALPPGVERALAEVELEAHLRNGLGRFWCAPLPEEVEQLRFVIGTDPARKPA